MYSISEKNKELVFEFFMVFSRFEYALKVAGWTRPIKRADPDWNEVSTKLQEAEAKDRNLVFGKAGILFTEPPREQIRLGDGRLSWCEARRSSNQSKKLIKAVKRVRNNLFHGGKYSDQEVLLSPRDRCLVTAALEVLRQLLEMPSLDEVRQEFKRTYTPEGS